MRWKPQLIRTTDEYVLTVIDFYAFFSEIITHCIFTHQYIRSILDRKQSSRLLLQRGPPLCLTFAQLVWKVPVSASDSYEIFLKLEVRFSHSSDMNDEMFSIHYVSRIASPWICSDFMTLLTNSFSPWKRVESTDIVKFTLWQLDLKFILYNTVPAYTAWLSTESRPFKMSVQPPNATYYYQLYWL